MGCAWKHLRKIVSSENARKVTNRTINFIKKSIEDDDEPFFICSHYWDVHFPYEPPLDWQTFYEKDSSQQISLGHVIEETERDTHIDWLKKRKDPEEILARYDTAIHYVDSEIKRIIKTLKKEDILEDTLIIITSDHGESLFEHGIYITHEGLFDEVIHVPLILHYPKRFPKGKRIENIVQHPDLIPTILGLIGIDSNIDFDGNNILPLIKGKEKKPPEIAYFQDRGWKMGVRTSNYKYITDYPLEETEHKPPFKNIQDANCKEQLYDLVNDPQEKNNLTDSRIEKASELRHDLFEMLESFKKKAKKKEKKTVKRNVQELKLSDRI